MKNQAPITAFLAKKRPNTEANESEHKAKRDVWMTPCVGLNDESWYRPRSTHKIIDCITGSPSIYHGAPRRDVLANKLFNVSEDQLSTDQKEQLSVERRSRATWRIEREGGVKSIYSVKCKYSVLKKAGVKHVVCDECLALREDVSLKNAINTNYASVNTIKHTRKDYMKEDAYQPTRNLFKGVELCATSLEKVSKQGDQEFWKVFSVRAAQGDFDHLQAFKGLIKAVAVRTERTSEGKGTTGMKFQNYFDDFVMTLTAISPKAAALFTENFAGRSLRSQRALRAATGMQLEDGLSPHNFEKIAQHLKTLGYDGPVSVASDQTVCIPSLRAHNSFIVGAQGGDIPFEDTNQLKEICNRLIATNQLCSKVCHLLSFVYVAQTTTTSSS